MRRVTYAERALRDLQFIDDYWRPRDPELVDELLKQLRKALALLIETPGSGSPLGNGRKWRLGRTPYVLLYRYTNSTLLILRVRHQRQNWRRPS